tara:strand:+ start:895 stop:1395 length:501 start_codon:yes stop_codon:yes gene_type:complete
MKNEYKFLNKHKKEFIRTYQNLAGHKWSFNFPIFIFNRCWFKLNKISLIELPKELEPDNSQEAPELIQYQQLLQKGHDQLLAIQECWHEFGIEDFHRSLRNFSKWEIQGNNGWTFKKYADLIIQYRESIDNKKISIPIIILARTSTEDHHLEWINQTYISKLKVID